MQAYRLDEIQTRRRSGDRMYLEFLRSASLSAGLYELPAAGADPQQPHTEDEVYCVVSGRGQIRVGADDLAVGPGHIVYVPAGMPHRFRSITESLSILAFFAPAEYSNAPSGQGG